MNCAAWVGMSAAGCMSLVKIPFGWFDGGKSLPVNCCPASYCLTASAIAGVKGARGGEEKFVLKMPLGDCEGWKSEPVNGALKWGGSGGPCTGCCLLYTSDAADDLLCVDL